MACSASGSAPEHPAAAVTLDLLSALQALADPSRLKIVRMLRQREQCVCHLTEALDLKQSTISHHLSVLKKAGLVVDRRDQKDARWSYYSLAPSAVALGQQIAALLDAGCADPTPADCSGR